MEVIDRLATEQFPNAFSAREGQIFDIGLTLREHIR